MDHHGEVLNDLLKLYPHDSPDWIYRDFSRQLYHLSIIEKYAGGYSRTLVDIGGHVGPFAPACALLGYNVTLIDDFGDPECNLSHIDKSQQNYNNILSSVHNVTGVKVLIHDVSKRPLPFANDSFDIVTCFEVIEHLHGGVKTMMHEIRRILRSGGLLVMSAPNAVNLRKRLTVPLGINNFSKFYDWYHSDVFRGHVREPVVKDLKRIAHDIGLIPFEIKGRNCIALRSKSNVKKICGYLLSPVCVFFPSLASNIYLVGKLAK
jgi:2-polyprenyl-3-methyl-5-hydroxy-6-metoxy-1,4-benzoquinol methylase